jgi:hypothetical protein
LKTIIPNFVNFINLTIKNTPRHIAAIMRIMLKAGQTMTHQGEDLVDIFFAALYKRRRLKAAPIYLEYKFGKINQNRY